MLCGSGLGGHMKGTIMAGGIGMESQNIVICTNYVPLVNPLLVNPPPPPPHSWITMRSFILMNFCISLLLYFGFLAVLSYDHVTHALSFLIIFRGWISQDNLSVARDRNNLSVLILNLLRICVVIICNLMTLHSYHNTCRNIWKITGQFTQVKCPLRKFVNEYSVIPFTNWLTGKTCLHNWPNKL